MLEHVTQHQGLYNDFGDKRQRRLSLATYFKKVNAKRIVFVAVLPPRRQDDIATERSLKVCAIINMVDFRVPPQLLASSLFLSTALVTLLPLLARHDLTQHDDAVAIHESDARKALAILECITHQRLLRLE